SRPVLREKSSRKLGRIEMVLYSRARLASSGPATFTAMSLKRRTRSAPWPPVVTAAVAMDAAAGLAAPAGGGGGAAAFGGSPGNDSPGAISPHMPRRAVTSSLD